MKKELLVSLLLLSVILVKSVEYKLIIVGGGFSGVSSTYYLDLANKFIGAGYSLDQVLLIESREVLGGLARSLPAVGIDSSATIRANILYNRTGNYNIDLGPQRIPHLTAKLDRVLSVLSGTQVEYTPYYTYEYTRGRRLACPMPIYKQYSPNNPYGIAGSCTSDLTSIKTPNSGNNRFGSAFDVSSFQKWSQKAPIDAINYYLLYGETNPRTCSYQGNCNDAVTGCECWESLSKNYLTMKSGLIDQVGHEGFAVFEQDFGGFYYDFDAGFIDPVSWTNPYYLREFDTDAINGYVVNGTVDYLNNLANPFLMSGGNVLYNTNVVKIDVNLTSTSIVTVDQNGNYQTYYGKFLIYAAPPNQITSHKINGTFSDHLLSSPVFNSVYCIETITIVVEFDTIASAFWRNLMPPNDPKRGLSEWVLLRAFGDQGHISRTECRHTIAGNTAIACRFVYNDFVAKQLYKEFHDQPTLYNKLWDLIRVDLAYSFQLDRSKIPKTYKRLNLIILDSAWCYVNGTDGARFTSQELKDYAANPIDSFPVCIAHQAFDVEFLGWKEGALRGASRCVDRIIPGTIKMLNTIMETTFPPCNCSISTEWCSKYPNIDSLDCYNNEVTHISGTETILPSIYCTERTWFNNYNTGFNNCVTTNNLNILLQNKFLN